MTATPTSECLNVSELCLSIGGSAILRGVNLSIRPNTVFCLMGRNGVGKSTTLKALMGLLPLDSGSITFSDQPIHRMSTADRARAGLGYVPQGREIFPHLTVKENLFIGTRAQGIKPTSDQIDRVFTLFPIIKEFLKRKGGMLSGGQQQQLAIARVLLTQPKLLILDEPTEGIQPNIIDQIGDAIKLLRRGGHHNEPDILAGIHHSLKTLRETDETPKSPLFEEASETVIMLLKDGVDKHAAQLGRFADCIEAIRNEQTTGNKLTDEIGSALAQLKGESKMSILLVEQYLDFCKELGDDFAILERGAVVSSGEMTGLTDEIVRQFLTV